MSFLNYLIEWLGPEMVLQINMDCERYGGVTLGTPEGAYVFAKAGKGLEVKRLPSEPSDDWGYLVSNTRH